MKNRKNKNYQSGHHIIPKSRGGGGLENIAGLTLKDHRLYHSMFSNLTPPEIIKYLVNHYWNGQVYHVEEFYRNYKNDKA